LLETLTQNGARAVIPTPVLSELLVGAGNAKQAYLNEITSSSSFLPAPFDVKAAVELAFLMDADGKQPKKLSQHETWAKVKFDRQVIAIAKATGVKDLYTDDTSLSAVAQANGLTVHHTWELPMPPQKLQHELDLPQPKPKEADDDGE
jgi:hypothetical protein